MMIRSVITCALLVVFVAPAYCLAQDTGGGNTGGGTTGNTGSNLSSGGGSTNGTGLAEIDPGAQGIDHQFDNIRNEIPFVGVSSMTVIHPYTRTGNELASSIDQIGARGQANNQGGANAAGSRGAGNAQFGGFNSPFEQLIASQIQAQNGGNQLGATPIRSVLRFRQNTISGPRFVRPTMNQRSVAMTNKIRAIPGVRAQNFRAEFR